MPVLQTFRTIQWDRVTHSLQRLFRGPAGELDRHDRFAGYALCVVTALTVSLYMSIGLSHAQWSVYADHELRSYLVAYPHLSLTDLPSLLSKTEVGYPGELTRFRPINYLFYASEALAWGNSYFLLNVARVAGLCVFSTFLLIGLYRFFPALVACALGALCLTSIYWKSVWIGFGPNEQYLALLGIPFTWAYVRLYWHALPGNAGMPVTWAVCLISAVLLVGTKEPMVVLAPALVVLLALSIYHDRHYDYRLVGCGIAIALMSLIVGAILSGLAHQGGADFYGNSVAPTERLAKLLDGARHYPFPRLLLLGVVTVGLRALAKKTLPGADAPRTIDVATQFQFWLLVLSFSQLVFYDGWPAGNRYEFPGELFVFISFLIPLYIGGQIIRSRRPELWMPFQAGVFVLLVGATLWRGYGGFRNDVAVYVARSQGFTAAILTAAAQAKSNPAIPSHCRVGLTL